MGGQEGNWASGIIGLTAMCEALVLVVVLLRVYTRIWIARAFWWDDFAIIMALVSSLRHSWRKVLIVPARHYHRRLPLLRQCALRLWKTRTVRQRTRIKRIQEIFIRRVDSDIRYPYVDQNLHLPLSDSHTELEVAADYHVLGSRLPPH